MADCARLGGRTAYRSVLTFFLLSSATTVEGYFTDSPDSKIARDLIEERIRPTRAEETAVVTSALLSVDDEAYRTAVEEFARRVGELGRDVIHAAGGIPEVSHYYASGVETLVSEDRSTNLVPITMAGDIEDATSNVHKVIAIADDISDASPIDILVTGPASIGVDFDEVAEIDLLTG